ncbi:aspartate 1-decarboxylase [Sulfoacidibacillus thermotolerans]|uniref:Aspartate 1-decarboxylase n=1 Tax=Sulfoacidibacillus thermotolerans TaxID=1765684 RepID=A0A2U3D9F0_SULT2|nr:aspartate 1-decarboxylase [Sulfoacidibacillus thermotolerans]PWI57909.1 aspartate 1-decarboxylase [Sulfoacidibacillus thermotolerans]
MMRTICKGKIHRATVTEARLDYVGSITIDQALMLAANIRPYEMVQVTSVANATLWRTYALPAPAQSGTICLNGPPARLFQPSDVIIILSLGIMDDIEYLNTIANIVYVDINNRITKIESHSLPSLLEAMLQTPNESHS